MKKTNWFSTAVKPVHRGLYEVCRPCMHGTEWKRCKMLWDGLHWVYPTGSYSDFGSLREEGNMWRGLAEKPE